MVKIKFPPGYEKDTKYGFDNQNINKGTNNNGQRSILFNYPYYRDENEI